jgi:hypothetical protein
MTLNEPTTMSNHIIFLQSLLHMPMFCHFNNMYVNHGKLCLMNNMDVQKSNLNYQMLQC